MMHSTSFWMLFIFLTRYVISLPHEAVCSPYHYEEQTLVKTVKLEQTVKDHIRHNEETEARVRGDFERLESEIKTLKSRLNEYDKEQVKEPYSCPSTYMYNEETRLCWRLEKTNNRHWFEARKSCTNKGGHLMILNTTATVSLIQEYLRSEDAKNVFVGASDILEEGKYRWIDGGHVGAIPWGTNQPSQNRVENCLTMYKGWGYKFGDDYCHGNYQFLCQITLN